MIAENDYAKYNIWNLGFVYSDNNVIREKYIFGKFPIHGRLRKTYCRKLLPIRICQKQKLRFTIVWRLFLRNHTRNNNFDIGISKVSNYAFSYNLLAQSAISGILSQQFIMAEGGFKSYINGTVDQWMLTHNVEANVWKMIDVYADFGVYKNRAHSPKFIWDSGIKFKVIPDFIEVYFPMQSSLGFDQNLKITEIEYDLLLIKCRRSDWIFQTRLVLNKKKVAQRAAFIIINSKNYFLTIFLETFIGSVFYSLRYNFLFAV